jgi:TRAP-type C4-dicarboxylate transport system permease small subunit
LIGVTALARVLPWDGRRLLRFIAGLAMLALAFTTHLTAASAVEPAAPAAVVAEAAPVVIAEESAPATTAPPVAPWVAPWVAGSTPATPVVALALLIVLVGVARRAAAGRAPPAL